MMNMITKIRIAITITEKNKNGNNGNNTPTQVFIKTEIISYEETLISKWKWYLQ